MNIDQSNMHIQGNQIIGQTIHFTVLEQYAASGLYAFYNLQELVNAMTVDTDDLTRDILGCSRDLETLMKDKGTYPRDQLLQRRDMLLDTVGDILGRYGRSLEDISRSYKPSIDEIDRSIGSFIMAHQDQVSIYRDEALYLAEMLDQLGVQATTAGAMLKRVIESMETIIVDGVTTDQLAEVVTNCGRHLNDLIYLFSVTSKVATRIRNLIRSLV